MNLSIKLDVHELTERCDFAAKEVLRGLRNAVDRSARAARREALTVAAKDIGGRYPFGEARGVGYRAR